MCGPRIFDCSNAFPTRMARLDFYLKNKNDFLLIKKMTWSRHFVDPAFRLFDAFPTRMASSIFYLKN